MMEKIYSGFLINPKSTGVIDYYPKGALVVANEKVIFSGSLEVALKNFSDAELIGNDDSIIMPGFVDLHTHLPQYPAIGFGKDELLTWLFKYIFPLEYKFSVESYANINSEKFFSHALKNGTTTITVFCSSQKRATDIAFEKADRAGIRAFIGKCMMDFGAPKKLLYSVRQNLSDSIELAAKWHGHDNGRLNYIFMPRFAGACTYDLLVKTAEVAKSENMFLSTHIAENLREVDFISKLFPDFDSYTDIYEKAGILGEKTILAHCIYLSEHDTELISNRQSKVAHCPVSNRFLRSGLMPFGKMRNIGLQIGLGTDIAAGYSLSVLHEAKEAIECSKTRQFFSCEDYGQILSAEEAFCMATIRGAEILGVDSLTGNLDTGKEADFIIYDGSEILNNDILISYDEILAQVMYLNSPEKILETYVRGKKVYSSINPR